MSGTNLADKRRCSVRPFSWTASPAEGESLLGYVTRMLSGNYYPSTANAFRQMGLPESYPERIVGGDPAVAKTLASAFLQDPGTIRQMMHPPVPDADGWIDFFGVPIRRPFREPRQPRLSPRTIVLEPWHHAVWDIRIFDFCPHSLERLMDRCPRCAHALTWRRSYGPTVCPRCVENGWPVVDLRDYPQTLIECDDVEALRFVTSMISPLVSVRDANRRSVAVELRQFSDGELFDMVVSFARYCSGDAVMQLGGRRRATEAIDAKHLSVAGRALMDGLPGIDSLLGLLRQGAKERPGHFGKRKEYGPLLDRIYLDARLPDSVRLFMAARVENHMRGIDEVEEGVVRRSEHRRDGDLVPVSTLARETGIGARTWKRVGSMGLVTTLETNGSKGPILFHRTEIRHLIEEQAAAVSIDRATRTLGLLGFEVSGIAEDGLLELVSPTIQALLRSSRYLRQGSIDRLVESILRRAQPYDDSFTSESHSGIGPVARRCFGVDVPWARILKAIIDGRLTVFERQQRRHDSLTSRLWIASDTDLRTMFPARSGRRTREEPERPAPLEKPSAIDDAAR